MEIESPNEDDEYEVFRILDHKWRNGWKFLVWWKDFPADQATWEPPQNFVSPNGAVNVVFKDYCLAKGLDSVFRKALGQSQ